MLAEHSAQNLCDLLVCVLDRAEERVDFAPVRRGVFEDAGDHSSLVLGGNRRVVAGSERHMQRPFADLRGELQQPLREVGGPDVGDRQPGPVEDALGKPVIGRRMALRVFASGDLRHVHDAVDPGLLRGLGEVGRRLQDPRADGVDEVGPL